jgi:hypothetical protein
MEAWTSERGQAVGSERHGKAGQVVEANGDGVVGAFAVSFAQDLGADRRRRSEERESLIDEMRAEIVENASLVALIFPSSRGKTGTPAVEI